MREARKSWSKQHPDFRTRRPLVEPYNLGRLHPEKEWWRLPKKGLSPQTFMGFPDVAHITKRGGSLYTHLMDGHTLTMVVYRCLEQKVEDITIWKRLSLQALKLAMSLDPYIISLLLLYFSVSPFYDYRFVATFTGRVLATLDQFHLLECSNVLMAMENDRFAHQLTKDRVIQHAEALCLTRAESIPAEEALRLLSAIKEVSSSATKNILITLGEVIEMADLATEEEDKIIDALFQCSILKEHIDQLCVSKMLDELCDRLESDKGCNHSRNIALMSAMATYGYRRLLALEIIQDRIKGNLHTCDVVELCRYMAYASLIEYPFAISLIRDEALKGYERLAESPVLSVQYLQGCMKSSRPLEPKELKLLVDLAERLGNMNQRLILDLYEALVNRRAEIPQEFTASVEGVMQHAWGMLPQMKPEAVCRLMHSRVWKDISLERDIAYEAFMKVKEHVEQLSLQERNRIIRFCSRDAVLAAEVLALLEEKHGLFPRSPEAAVELLRIYERVQPDPESKLFQKAVQLLTYGKHCIRLEHHTGVKQLLREYIRAQEVKTHL